MFSRETAKEKKIIEKYYTYLKPANCIFNEQHAVYAVVGRLGWPLKMILTMKFEVVFICFLVRKAIFKMKYRTVVIYEEIKFRVRKSAGDTLSVREGKNKNTYTFSKCRVGIVPWLST